MTSPSASAIPTIVEEYETDVLAEWIKQQIAAVTVRRDLLKDDELRAQSRQFLSLFCGALKKAGTAGDGQGAGWVEVREFLAELST